MSCAKLCAVAVSAVAAMSFFQASSHGAVMGFNVPNQTVGDPNDDDGVYTEAGFRVSEASFTGLNIQDGMLQDGGWGGGFELASTTPGQLFSLDSFDAKTRYNNPAGITVYGYDADNAQVAVQQLTLTGSVAPYTLPSSFSNLSRVMFRNDSDPEFDNIAVTPVPEPAALGLVGLGALGLLARRRRATV